MGVLCVLSARGETKVEWELDVAETVREAERIFRENAARGYVAFTADVDLDTSRQIREFEPKASRIVQSPPLVGG